MPFSLSIFISLTTVTTICEPSLCLRHGATCQRNLPPLNPGQPVKKELGLGGATLQTGHQGAGWQEAHRTFTTKWQSQRPHPAGTTLACGLPASMPGFPASELDLLPLPDTGAPAKSWAGQQLLNILRNPSQGFLRSPGGAGSPQGLRGPWQQVAPRAALSWGPGCWARGRTVRPSVGPPASGRHLLVGWGFPQQARLPTGHTDRPCTLETQCSRAT